MKLPLVEGQELPLLEITPGLPQVLRYCALGWAFPAIFYDEEAAKAQGMPGKLVPGPLKAGLLYRYVDDWVGDVGWIRHVRAAHRRPDTQGRALTLTGTVARLYEEGGRQRADLELAIINDRGEPSVRGFATVELFA